MYWVQQCHGETDKSNGVLGGSEQEHSLRERETS